MCACAISRSNGAESATARLPPQEQLGPKNSEGQVYISEMEFVDEPSLTGGLHATLGNQGPGSRRLEAQGKKIGGMTSLVNPSAELGGSAILRGCTSGTSLEGRPVARAHSARPLLHQGVGQHREGRWEAYASLGLAKSHSVAQGCRGCAILVGFS